MSISALQAAKVACEASGWKLSNLQLQKILYIAHMVFAGRQNGERLISGDEFEAWSYGPVLPSVYHYVSAFGARPVGNVFRRIESPAEGEEVKIIRDAVKSLGDTPPFRLVEFTHRPGGAWDKNYYNGLMGIHIPHDDICAEYKTRFPDAERQPAPA
ncbi:Panacea domain-containing protein [Halomonas elongata]|uniref:Panacea domain-containing protein n=1 Tax=Halomonas elongata TaxID=2746 RepID=UPI00255B2FE8|nr:Panacea domain-containing protein [Halomonas elongata]MDL4864689.1 Panacea domain-containing protein [Halomonas elongata]